MAQFADDLIGPGTGDIGLDTHSPDTGTSWVVQLGNVGGLDDSADAAMRDQPLGQTEPGWIASDDLGDADMQVWVQRNGTVNDYNWLAAVRISDNGTNITCYGIISYGNGGAGYRLVEIDAGSRTDLDTADGGTSDDWYRIVANGTDLYAYAAGSSTEPASPEEDTNWGAAVMSYDITGGLNPTVTRQGLAAYTSAGGGNVGVWAAYRADTYPAAAAPAPDITKGVEFAGDGTRAHVTGFATGPTLATELTLSMWIELAAGANGYCLYQQADNDGSDSSNLILQAIESDGEGYVNIDLYGPGGTTILADHFGPFSLDESHHIMLSWEKGVDAWKALDGVRSAVTENTTDDWRFRGEGTSVGDEFFVLGTFDPGSTFGAFEGCVAEVWLKTEFMADADASVEEFRTTVGGRVDLGADGSNPVAGQPELYLSGGADNFIINFGSVGGPLTVVGGTLTDCPFAASFDADSLTVSVTLDAATLAADSPMTADALDVAVTLDAATLTADSPMTADALDVAVTLDAATLTGAGGMDADALDVAVTLDAATLTADSPMTADALDVAVTLDAATLTADSPMTADAMDVAVTLDAATLTADSPMTADALDVAVTLDAVTLTLPGEAFFPADDISVSVVLDAATLTADSPMTADALDVAALLDAATLTADSPFAVDDISVSALLEQAVLLAGEAFSADDLDVAVAFDLATLLADSPFSANDLSVAVLFDAASIADSAIYYIPGPGRLILVAKDRRIVQAAKDRGIIIV